MCLCARFSYFNAQNIGICYAIGCFVPPVDAIFLSGTTIFGVSLAWNKISFVVLFSIGAIVQNAREKGKKFCHFFHILNECVSCCYKMPFKFRLFLSPLPVIFGFFCLFILSLPSWVLCFEADCAFFSRLFSSSQRLSLQNLW